MDNDFFDKTIILIGPSGAGKSTIANILSSRLRMPRLCLDSLASKIKKNVDFNKGYKSIDEFNEYLINIALEDKSTPIVCDFGAGHSYFIDQVVFESVKNTLSIFKNIILLLPSEDKILSLEALNSRTNSKNGKEENIYYLDSNCNTELATKIIYTDGKDPYETSSEIINLLENNYRKKI